MGKELGRTCNQRAGYRTLLSTPLLCPGLPCADATTPDPVLLLQCACGGRLLVAADVRLPGVAVRGPVPPPHSGERPVAGRGVTAAHVCGPSKGL